MKRTLIGIVLVLMAPAVFATVIYDETVSGDVVSTNDNPVGVDLGTLSIGVSTVIGTLPGEVDNDWYQFSIGAGTELTSIILAAFGGDGGNVGWAVGGVVQGNNRGPFDTGAVGTDLLNTAELNVVRPIGPGSYAFKAGTGTNINRYILDFNVKAVPEPGTLGLLALGLLGLAFARRKVA